MKIGDLIAVAAPSGPVKKEAFLAGADFIAGRGYRVTYREDLFTRSGYLAGDDRRRTAELNSHLRDREVKAILLARGGYGSSRIAGRLDTSPLKRYPKIFAGYSDATCLLLAFQKRPGLALFHGPFVSDGPGSLSRLLRTLEGKISPLTISPLRPLRGGRAEATVTGGNLSLLAHSIGTPFEVDTRSRILFVEEVSESPYRVDRMIRQLVLAGKFRSLKGLLIGRFAGGTGGDRRRCESLLLEAVGKRDIPVAAGFPAGHVSRNVTFPLGVPAAIDTDTRSVTFSPFLSD